MKKNILNLSLFIAPFTIIAQNVNIPNANFKAALVANATINTNADSEIQLTEAAAYSGDIDLYNKGINDLTGIEAFPLINALDCSMNQLTSINLSSNTALTMLFCADNQLTSLDLSTNTLLTTVSSYNNFINTINITNNINIGYLDLQNNQLTSLDLQTLTSLTIFSCASNALTSLNIKNGNNTSITLFAANNNPSLTCIEVDDVNYSTTTWTNIDPTASFSLNCTPTGVLEHNTANSFSCYPNPSNAFLTFILSDTTNILIINTLGQEVFNKQINNNESINVSTFENGIYFLKDLNSGNTIKFIKQ